MFQFEEINWEKLIIQAGTIVIKVLLIFLVYQVVKSVSLKIVRNSFERVVKRKSISSGRAKTLQKLAENMITYVLIFILVATLFNIFGFSVASLIAGAGIVGLAISFGAQGLVSDVVTGFFLLLEKQMEVNDYVTVGEFEGIVESIGLRTTQIRSFDGTLNFIPNREIVTVRNHSRGNMRALVDISISYGEDLNRAMEILEEVCRKMAAQNPMIVEGPNVLGIQAFGTSEIILRIIAKTKNMEQWAVERELRKAIKEAFDAHGIELPAAQRLIIRNDSK